MCQRLWNVRKIIHVWGWKAEMDLENKSQIPEWGFGISGRNSERSFGMVVQSGVRNFEAKFRVYTSELRAEFQSKHRNCERN